MFFPHTINALGHRTNSQEIQLNPDGTLVNPSAGTIPRGATTRDQAIQAQKSLDAQKNSSSSSSGFCSFTTNNTKLQDLLKYTSCIINTAVIPLIFALAMAMFIWGVVQFVINSDEEAKKEKGRQFMIWGVIALTVMVSVWGLVAILGNTFGLNTGFIPQVK